MTTNRRIVSAVTLAALVAVLVVGVWIGWQTLSAPLPGSNNQPQSVSGPKCNDGVRRGDVVRPRDVTVSVYNAGSRSGLAGQTQSELEARGFISGEVGNAPDDLLDVRFVRVLARTKSDPAAKLVALQFGANTLIEPVQEDLGPGVEVVVGDSFLGLVDAPNKIKAQVAGSGC